MKNAADHKEHSDAELAYLLRECNEQAFTKLYQKYWGNLYVNILKLVEDEQVAE